jgi:uracil-DNA glycosylase
MPEALKQLSTEIAACRICVEQPRGKALPHEPRPVCVLSDTARIAICGQAPGTRVHASGIPFSDPSGDRLRDWMGVGSDVFYDARRIAIVPMGFCFPGQDAKGGDLPPRRECAPLWRDRIFAAMPQVELLLAIGQYAQSWHLREMNRRDLTSTVAAWREIFAETSSPRVLPLPHPSWRNSGWLKRHPWFEAELLPFLRQKIAESLGAGRL